MSKIFTLAALLFLSVQMYGQAGTLNPLFNGGIVTTSFTEHAGANDMAVQNDGKIILAGYAQSGGVSHLALVRYTTSGTLDASFGTNGKVVLNLSAAGSWLEAVTIQSDGKILAGGSVANGPIVSFVLLRFLANGTPDAAFGTNGIVTTSIGSYAYLKDLLIQPDGKIIASGESTGAVVYDYTVVRYTPNGTIDNSFSGGIVTQNIAGDDYVKESKLQPDGKIVVAGSSNFMFSMARFHPDGTLDGSFGNEGKVTTVVGSVAGNDNCLAIALQADGKVIAVGEGFHPPFASDMVIARYTVSGQLDNSFGTGGLVVDDVSGSFDQASCVSVQNDGKIVVAGNTFSGGQPKIIVARYFPNGSTDVSFGNGGQTITSIGIEAYVNAMVLKGLNIYAAGIEKNNPDAFALTAYVNDAAPLPVRFASFTAQKMGTSVALNWQTEAEWDTKSFIAEKSSDGRIFTAFAEIAAAGNSSSIKNYRTVDDKPYKSITYYRIKSVDTDGASSYTKVLAVKNEITKIEIFPNPVRNAASVQLPDGINGQVVISINDISGRAVYASNIKMTGNPLIVSLPMNSLASGMYMIHIKGDELDITQRILKD